MDAQPDRGPDALIGFATESLAFTAKLGEGGMGAVYKGRQIRLDRPVAIKVLSPRLVSDRAFLDRFGREARLLAKLAHPHVVACHDFSPITGPDGNVLHVLVMEFVDGCTIYQRSCEGLPVREALELYRQVAEGLAAAHRAGVLHRDLKPDNILVTKDRVAKIVDFGLAKHAAGEDSHHLTLAGVILGTPAYMAPEVCRGGEPTALADCYSLACSLFHTLTGQPPFPWAVPLETIQHQINTPPPRLSTLNQELASLDALMERCLNKDPERRFADAAALAKALEEAVAIADGRPPRSSGSTRIGTVRVLPAAAGKKKPASHDDLDLATFDRAERAGGASGHGAAETAHDDRALAEADIPGLDEAPPRRKTSTRTAALPPPPVPAPSAAHDAPAAGGLELMPLPEKPKPVEAPSPVAEAVKPKGPSDEQLRAVEEKRKLLAKRSEALKTSGETPKGDAIGHERLGDLHADEGRPQEAIAEYQRALAVIPKPENRLPIEQKITRLESRLRQRLLIRIGIAAGVVVVLGLVAVLTHGLVGTAGTATDGTGSTGATAAGGTEGTDAAVSREVAERIAAIERSAKNPKIPWSEIRADIQAIMPLAGSRKGTLTRILAEADAYQQQFDATMAAIAATWDTDPAAALAKATALRHDDPRFDTALIPRLPVPGRLVVQAPAGVQAQVHIAGRPVASAEAITFCRHAAKPTSIAVTAPGCEPWTQELAPSPQEMTVTARLVLAPRWSIAATAPATLRAGRGLVLVMTGSAVLTVDAITGQVQGTLGSAKVSSADGVAFIPRPFTGLRTENVVLATSDGRVVSIPFAAGGLHRVLFRTAGPAVDAVERDLVLRSGSRGRFTIEQEGQRYALAAYKDGGEPLWRKPLTASVPPLLMADEQQVMAVDDAAVRIFDQEGAAVAEQPLPPGARTGSALPLAGGAALLIPTATGLRLLRAVPGKGFAPAVAPEGLDGATAVTPLVEGDGALALGSDGQVRLLRWQKDTLAVVMSQPAPAGRRWTGGLGLGAGLACACDDQGVLQVWNSATRAPVATLALREPLVQPCLLSDGLVVVQYRDQRVVGYALGK